MFLIFWYIEIEVGFWSISGSRSKQNIIIGPTKHWAQPIQTQGKEQPFIGENYGLGEIGFGWIESKLVALHVLETILGQHS